MRLLSKCVMPLVIISMVACHSSQTETKNGVATIEGMKVDSSTGLTAKYTGIEPGKIFLMMNGEVLNHTDIPIGDSFTIVNQNPKGFVVKFGNISLGCSLLIEDSTGKKILSKPDLFSKNNLIDEANATLLTCNVPTNDSMKWEERYKVTVVFWDKYGNGKIENTVTFRSIDIP